MSSRNSHPFRKILKSDATQSRRDMPLTFQSLGYEFLTRGMVSVAMGMFLAGVVLAHLHHA